ncbi:MAG: 2-amino-4-hydroxy-6-hydroxymethyldihydropteridine diphosphokinase [Chloracidobacterium sp.]|nr:2-amino-4-hydroxy-6-hydroxymethyldihydropteridine diphosphokinase [Chloracidobacterium sp.]
MDKTTTIAYLGLGSNLGDRAGNLLMAVRCLIEASFVVQRLSSIFETEPIDLDTDQQFLNMVAEVRLRDQPHPNDGQTPADRVSARSQRQIR